MNVAVIPARGGSKRIPDKNIRLFAGKPIIAYSIEAALRSGLFARVIVSTDDARIADIALALGAEIPFMRPRELADDHTGTTEVIAHAVERIMVDEPRVTAACAIYATAPFIRTADLSAGLDLLAHGRWSYVFAATTYPYPILRSIRRRPDGGVEMLFPERFTARSQDLPEAFHDAGQFYWGTAHAWLRRDRIFAEWSTVVMVPRWRTQDIDTEDDWVHAERLALAMDPSH